MFFCYFFRCQAADHSKLKILIYQGTICSVVLSTNTIVSSISVENAIPLTGIGTNSYYLGSLTMYLFNNKATTPYTLELNFYHL